MSKILHKYLIYHTRATNKNYLKKLASCLLDDENDVVFIGNTLNKNNIIKNNIDISQKQSNLDTSLGLRFYVIVFLKALYHFVILYFLQIYFVVFLKFYRISCLIIPADREVGRINSIIKACHILKIPVVLVPNAKSGSIKETLHLRRHSKYHLLPKNNFFMSKLIEQAVKDNVNSEYFLIFGTAYSLALYYLGMLPKYPWGRLGGGGSSFCFLDTKNTLDDYKNENINKDKFIITGSLEHDTIFRNRLKKNFHEKIAVVGLNNFYECNLYSYKTTREKHIQFLELCKKIASLGYRIVISLHPTMERKYYQWIEEEYEFEISSQSLSNIMGYADLYLVHGWSSTSEWAISLNLPLFILSDEGLTSNLKADNSSVFVSSSDSGLIDSIKLLETKKDSLNINKTSFVDGNAATRIKNNLTKIIEENKIGYPCYR